MKVTKTHEEGQKVKMVEKAYGQFAAMPKASNIGNSSATHLFFFLWFSSCVFVTFVSSW
jgi:hypothetical protein